MKKCLNAVAETLFEGKQKDDMCEKIKQIPMSASTATRKSEILADDVLAQLDAAIQSAPCISLAIDESTDVTDNAQLLVYVRFFNKDKKEICEDLLGVTPPETHTRGQDIYAAIRDAEEEGHRSEAGCLCHHRWCSCHDGKREGGCVPDERGQPRSYCIPLSHPSDCVPLYHNILLKL